MNTLLVITFLATLIYFSLTVDVKSYIRLIGLQGLLLFFIAIIELKEFSLIHFGFILTETLLFKAIAVPLMLYNVSKKNQIFSLKNAKKHRVTKGFNLIIINGAIIVLSFVLGYDLHNNHLELKYFVAAISSILIGMIFIIINKNILIHLISYLIIENGIYLFSLSLGGEMPMIVNTAILLDIFSSVLLLGIFLNKIGTHYKQIESESLTNLKD